MFDTGSFMPCWFCFLLGLSAVVQLVLAIWVYGDAKKRGENEILWLIVFLVGGIIGLIIWLIVRPPIQTYDPYSPYRNDDWLNNDRYKANYYKEQIKGIERCPMCSNESLRIEHDDSAFCGLCGYATSNIRSKRGYDE